MTMGLDSRKKAFNAGVFSTYERFLAFLFGDELYEHRNIYFKCDSNIFPVIYQDLLKMENKGCFRIEAAKEEGFTGYFLLTGISRSALEKADAQRWQSIPKPKNSLRSEGLKFDEARSYLIGKSHELEIPPNTKENGLYAFMFKEERQAGILADWSEFMEHLTGSEYLLRANKKKEKEKRAADKKMVRDLIDRANVKVQARFFTDDLLFSFVRNCVRRNF